MKTTTDRMGGFISAKIVDIKQIESFLVSDGKVSISYKDEYFPQLLNTVKNGISANAPSTTSKSGEIFNVDININIKERHFIKYRSFNKYLAILELPTGDLHVFGTLAFPLTMKIESAYSETPRGRIGYVVNLSGKQPHNILIMQ